MSVKEELSGKVITVLGPISGEDLGFTLPHEHILLFAPDDLFFVGQSAATDRALALQPVRLENLRWVRYHDRDNLDNMRIVDEQLAIKEIMPFKLAGGKTICEITPIELGRDPRGLSRISQITGLNIIMGTGYYTAASSARYVEEKSEEQIADGMVSDITVGATVSDSTWGEQMTNIRAGVIAEIGASSPLRDSERKVLHAAAYAQQQTGVAIIVHPGRNENGPLEVIEALREAGAQLDRVVICHMDRCGYLLETRLKILEAGCYVEYDVFGTEGYYPASLALADGHLPDMLNDVGRIKQIAELIDMGYLRQILISHDTCMKTMLACWGGHGYAHIIENVIPLMRVYGYTEEQIHTLTVENPRDMLAIR